MSAFALPLPPTEYPAYRFSVEQYHQMVGEVVGEGCELLEGVVFEKGRAVPYRFDSEQYHRMIELGILGPSDRVELIRGEVVPKMGHNNPHGTSVERLDRRFQRLMPDEFAVRCQLPIVFPDSDPEPDAVICPSAERRGGVHPTPAEVYLVAEVADSSVQVDRGGRLQLYAEGRIPVYWVVNIPDRQIEVYTNPSATGYSNRTDYRPGQEIPLILGGVNYGSVPVASVLPAAGEPAV